MSGSDKVAKAAARHRSRLNQYLAAGKQHLQDRSEFTLLGQRKTWGEWRQVFAQMLRPYEQRDRVLADLKVQAGQLLLDIRKNVPLNRAYVVAFADALQGRFGKNHPVLKSFEVIKRKPKKPDSKTRARAVISRRNTRLARGTTGKRQKAKIKGPKARLVLLGPDKPR